MAYVIRRDAFLRVLTLKRGPLWGIYKLGQPIRVTSVLRFELGKVLAGKKSWHQPNDVVYSRVRWLNISKLLSKIQALPDQG